MTVVTVTVVGSAGGPSEPVGLTAPIVSQDFLTLSWRRPEDPGLSNILGYVIHWNEAGSARYRDPFVCCRVNFRKTAVFLSKNCRNILVVCCFSFFEHVVDTVNGYFHV